MRDASRSRQRAVLTFVSVVACIGASLAACTQYKREAGETCLKTDDCISGICTGQICQTAPPMLAPGESYPGVDASVDASQPDTGLPDQGAPDLGAPDASQD